MTLATATYRATYNVLFLEYEIFRAQKQIEPQARIEPHRFPFVWSWYIGGDFTWRAPPGQYRFYVTIYDPEGNAIGSAQHAITISHVLLAVRLFSSIIEITISHALLAVRLFSSIIEITISHALLAVRLFSPFLLVLLPVSTATMAFARSKSVVKGARASFITLSILLGFMAVEIFAETGVGLAAVTTLVMFVGYWVLLNSRIRIHFSRTLGRLPETRAMVSWLESNPVNILIGSCCLLLAGISSAIVYAWSRLVDTTGAMRSANAVASYLFLLILLTVVVKALWDVYLSRKSRGFR